MSKAPRKDEIPRPPRHLRPATKKWWTAVVTNYVLEDHHLRLLTLAAEAWDRCQEAREVLEKEGLTFTDKAGQPKARPEVAIERDSRTSFARMLRELCLDVAPPEEHPRPPRRPGTER